MYINYIKNTFNFLCFSFQLFSVVQLLRNFAYNLVSNIILYHIGQPTKIGSCLFFFIFCLNLLATPLMRYTENENLELETKITYETALSRMKF